MHCVVVFQGTVIVQEIISNGLIDRDDRLRVGDQLLEVRYSPSL